MLIFLELPFPAPSRVLLQITPVLGVLVGVVVTLILIAICIVIFVKIKNKVSESARARSADKAPPAVALLFV
jgi:large-conductance mechanosensitive channel